MNGMYLTNPAGVTITGRTNENAGVNLAEMEGFQITLGDRWSWI
jgi:hypothetical protein